MDRQMVTHNNTSICLCPQKCAS